MTTGLAHPTDASSVDSAEHPGAALTHDPGSEPARDSGPVNDQAHAEPSGGAERLWKPAFRRVMAFRAATLAYCVPPALEPDSEPCRRASLVTDCGLLALSGSIAYGAFRLLLGDLCGAAIVICSGAACGASLLLLRRTRSVWFAGHVLCGSLFLGLYALAAADGGIHSAASAWLAALPLCAVLMLSERGGMVWAILSIAAVGAFGLLGAAGVHFPVVCPARWQGLSAAAGYTGLAVFLCLIAAGFERARLCAMRRAERAAETADELIQRLKRMDQEKNEFLGMAAHDLKNPLNIIMGFAEIIASARGGAPERTRQDAQYIIEAAQRMIALITELIDVNAIEHGRFPIETCIFDLGLIGARVVENYSEAAERKRLSIYSTGSIAPAMVTGDCNAAYRILDNLVSNAMKFSPPGADIYVRVRNAPDCVVWEVQDQGPGIPEAEQVHLFQKFTKLSARPTGGESSTGLGLAIASMLARLMNGTVQCQSKAGAGATFAVRLPAAPPEDAAAAPEKNGAG